MSNDYDDRDRNFSYDRDIRNPRNVAERGRYWRSAGTGAAYGLPYRDSYGNAGRSYDYRDRDEALTRGGRLQTGSRGYGYDEADLYRNSVDDYWPGRWDAYRSYSTPYDNCHARNRYAGERDWWDRASDEVASWFGSDEAEARRRMDAARDGEFRGRGPRGYQRSDSRITEDINDRLTDQPYLDATDIEVSVSNGEVTLSGKVGNRYDKRRAEDIADSVSGVTHVQNNLRVNQAETSSSASGLSINRSAARAVK
jgi:osmotically-inducible protein OsmY